jgi:hypothetical protein
MTTDRPWPPDNFNTMTEEERLPIIAKSHDYYVNELAKYMFDSGFDAGRMQTTVFKFLKGYKFSTANSIEKNKEIIRYYIDNGFLAEMDLWYPDIKGQFNKFYIFTRVYELLTWKSVLFEGETNIKQDINKQPSREQVDSAMRYVRELMVYFGENPQVYQQFIASLKGIKGLKPDIDNKFNPMLLMNILEFLKIIRYEFRFSDSPEHAAKSLINFASTRKRT